MTKTFIFDSDSKGPLEVEIQIECRDRDGVDATFDIIGMADSSNHEVMVGDLPEPEQTKLERECDDWAQELACEAAQDYLEGEADALYDRMKEGD